MSYVLASIALGSTGQFLLKVGVNRIGGVRLRPETLIATLCDISTEPYIVCGLALFVLSMLIWLTVISRMELSTAYPMVSLSYVIVTALSRLFLGEPLTGSKLLGMSFILAGILAITQQW